MLRGYIEIYEDGKKVVRKYYYGRKPSMKFRIFRKILEWQIKHEIKKGNVTKL